MLFIEMRAIFLPQTCRTVWHLYDVGDQLIHSERFYDCCAAGVPQTIHEMYPPEIIVLARLFFNLCKSKRAEAFRMLLEETSIEEFSKYARITPVPKP